MKRRSPCLWIPVACLGWLSIAHAQTQVLIDKVVARVGPTAITLTDAQAALGLGLVEVRPGEDRAQAAVRQLIDRQLILQEVARFPPSQPNPRAVAAEVQRGRAAAGDGLAALMTATGLDEDWLTDLARDTLRIEAYLNQRFGVATPASDAEAAEYYRAHPAEFMRDGVSLPYEQVEALVRERAAAERRRATVARWLTDLRARAEIVEPG